MRSVTKSWGVLTAPVYLQLHLFDVDLGERMRIVESELNVGGDRLTTVDTGQFQFGWILL